MKNSLKKLSLATSLCCASMVGSAAEDPFATWMREMEQGFNGQAQQPGQQPSPLSSLELEFQRYKQDIERQWQEYVESDRTHWVAYQADKSTRSIVDFEQGKVVLETVVDAAEVKGKSEQQVRNLAAQKLSKQLQAILLKPQQGPKESPVAAQLVDDQQQPVTTETAEQFFEQTVASKVEPKASYTTSDNKQKVRYSVEVDLVPDHIQVRAKKYLPVIERYSRENDLEPALVLAVIHTESHFNPMAQSHAPAYGLMQLVPSSGGRDAYRKVFGKDGRPEPEYLYNPENNIRLGTAYLALLGDREFRRVEDATTKRHLITAAYNTGAGNVSRGFTGSTRGLSKTVDAVNRMDPQEVYAKLRSDLPYEETRNYVKKVDERYAMYRKAQIN